VVAKMANRDSFFDNAKILLMLLVVLGHVLEKGQGKLCLSAYEWIYSFHMPLFVFISGCFTKTGNNEKFVHGILKLGETYIVFTLIHVSISLFLLGERVNILVPCWTLWYLLSLIWWRLILYITPLPIRNNHLLLVVLSVVLCLVMGWIPIGKTFSFHRTFSFLPFFMLGYVAAQTGIINKIKLPPILAITFMMIVFGGILFFPISSKSFLTQDYGYNHYNNPLFAFLFRFGWLFFASLMSVCFLSVVSRKEYKWTHLGQLTLFIYMYHSVILKWCFLKRDEYHIPVSFPYCVLYAIIVLCIIYLMSRVKFFHWLLNPVTPIVYNRKKRTT
jgi:fucose 4-O-acetylase-like acetyltransferase